MIAIHAVLKSTKMTEKVAPYKNMQRCDVKEEKNNRILDKRSTTVVWFQEGYNIHVESKDPEDTTRPNVVRFLKTHT